MKNIMVVDSEIETAHLRKFVTAREIVVSLPLTKGVGHQLKVSTSTKKFTLLINEKDYLSND